MDHDGAESGANQEGLSSRRHKLADLSPIQTTTNDELAQRHEYRKSLRLRPSQLLQEQYAEPLSPISRPSRQPSLQHRGSKMSLFSLFSKPKIEKAHGYAEQGLKPPSVLDLNARSEHLDASGTPRSAGPDIDSRPPTAMSSWTNGLKPAKSTKSGTVHDKPRQWAPPPLFQAYPQASKHGKMEVSTVAETVAAKAKARKAAGSRSLITEHLSSDAMAYSEGRHSKNSARPAIDNLTRPTSSPVELPRKIVVLVTSGYLLQYAETGPSDRLPERILQLGKDSAAFACDLISGKHYVLQISHAVNSQGMSISSNTGNIFSRLGMKSTTSKKMTSTLLLVMEDPKEMDSWMVAIREEIEILGGTRLRPDTAVRAMLEGTADGFNELKKSPSLSHRYNVSRASGLTNPSRQDIENMPPPPSSKQEKHSFDKSETNTIDDIEQEMEHMVDERLAWPPQEQQRDCDAQSVRSSIALSAESHHLRSPQSSSRISYSTFATTVATSRTSSPIESQLAESEKWSSDSSRDSEPSRSSYGPRSSLGVGNGKRRSVMPSVTSKEQQMRTLHASVQPQSQNVSRHPPMPNANPLTPPRKLAVAVSEPNLRAAMENKVRHDSRLQDVAERPLSIVADLPSSADLKVSSPNKRLSLMHAANAQAHAYRLNVRPLIGNSMATSSPVMATVNGMRRHSQNFSIPLKVNPSNPAELPRSQSETRAGHVDNDAVALRRSSRTMLPTPEAHQGHRGRSSSGRLSLFPSQVDLVSPPDGPLSAITLAKHSSSGRTQHQAQTSARALKRPVSLQVRADHAPFLSGISNTATVSNARAAPIRSLKPSRSAYAINTVSSAATSRPLASPTDPFMKPSVRAFHSQPSPVQEDEAGDRAMPLPRRSASPKLVRPGSRQGGAKLRTKNSLPELDLGMPLAALGPPAPPPKAPLPRPPTAARSVSPVARRTRPGESHGLGITVST